MEKTNKIDTTGFDMVKVPAGALTTTTKKEKEKEKREKRIWTDAEIAKMAEIADEHGYNAVENNLRIKLGKNEKGQITLSYTIVVDEYIGLSNESLVIGGQAGVNWTDEIEINGKIRKFMYRITVWEPFTRALGFPGKKSKKKVAIEAE